MKIAALERTLATLVKKTSTKNPLEALRELSAVMGPERELAAAAGTLAVRLQQTRPSADPEDVGKPWV